LCLLQFRQKLLKEKLSTVRVKKKYPDLKVHYQAIGSGDGIHQTITGTVDFTVIDAN
jgi:ABC-type phosphate transport system substrate-binding protein